MRTVNKENYGMGLLLHYNCFVPVDDNEGNCDVKNSNNKKKTLYQPKAIYWKYFKYTETLTAVPCVKDIA